MYKNSLKNILYPVFLAVAVVIGILIGMSTIRKTPESPVANNRLSSRTFADNKLFTAISLIDRMYVDSVDIDTLTNAALSALLEELDPHSIYIPADRFADANDALEGEFDGIGITFNMATDTVVVLSVIPNGPSEKAAVQNGDRIIRINDSLVAGQKINQNDIVKMLKGKRGTTVDLSIKRQGISDLVDITVTRGIIPVKSLDAAFILKDDIAFIKLTAFSKFSLREIDDALSNLREQGMKKLIFDLRGNGGGFLDQAIGIANEFLPYDKVIVTTEYKYGKKTQNLSDGRGKYQDIPLVILVDEESASSSEILAGAIQDNDRGTIMGRRTFGKGLVQDQIPFSDGSAMRLTIARYYTPTGRSIQKPYVYGDKDYGRELYDRAQHNELFSADSIKFADSLKFVTPGGNIVYGGGGIMPDVFISLDTTRTSRYFVEVSKRNILYKYTLEYADRHRAELNSIRTLGELDSFLNSDTNMLNDFIAYAEEQGVKPNYPEINRSKSILIAQLRAYIGRNTPLEDSGFYYNIYPVDRIITAAIEELES